MECWLWLCDLHWASTSPGLENYPHSPADPTSGSRTETSWACTQLAHPKGEAYSWDLVPLTVHLPPSVVISQKTGTGTLGPEG